MQIKTVLLALVATVSADNLLRPAQVPAIAARATGTSDQCTAALFSLADTAPTFPPDLESFAETATMTDPCKFTGPASLSSEYSSYMQQAKSWLGAHNGELSSLASSCPAFSTDIASATSMVCRNAAAAQPTGIIAAAVAAAGFIGAVAAL